MEDDSQRRSRGMARWLRRRSRGVGERCAPSRETVYNIIYADPPWNYSNNQCHDPTRGGKVYPLMSQDEIKALPVASIAAPDCALFLWATMPKLQEALDVIAAWGFRYVTCAFTWVKIKPGISAMGFSRTR